MQEATVKEEVERRLGDLFDEKAPHPENPAGPAAFPLRELKATVLSVDWEINDQTMSRLIEHVEQLQGSHENDKVISTFLKLLGAVGRYIKSNKANAHPDAVKLLNSIFLKLEKVILSHDMSQESKRRALLGEVEKFKGLRERIAERRATQAGGRRGPVGRRTPSASAEQRPDAAGGGGTPPEEALARAVAEIKMAISAEFAALRAEIRALHGVR